MSYIRFDKNKLINLEYILKRELLRSNRAGSYASRTVIGCNTRKYHGLLVVPQPTIDEDNHVLLSNLDETIIQHDAEFNLGIHKYPGGVYHPKGHKYARDFQFEPIPFLVYRVGGVVLRREIIFASNDDRILIRYTLEDAHSPTTLRLKPFLAFRNVHKLTRANVSANTGYKKAKNGISVKMYAGYSNLYMQTSKKAEYIHAPGWNYNIEYQEEMERGYDFQEDLFVPGYFEMPIKKGESVVFSASLKEYDPASFKRSFSAEVRKRTPRNSFENCLINAAQQFIVKRGNKTEVIAGFPWFGRWGRDTFISLPGLTLAVGDDKTCKAVLDTMVKEMKGPLFPNIGAGEEASYNSVDAPMWFFWAVQQYTMATGTGSAVWKDYGKKMKSILEGFRKGSQYNIRMLENGLVYAGEQGKALTWMDAVVDGKPVTPRIGCPVEINALWYNAIMFSLELAENAGEKSFVKTWNPIAGKLRESFLDTFWDEKKGYLADYVNGDHKDWSVRPNMIIATSLPYRLIDRATAMSVLETARKELLTPRGLRTLSPKSSNYKGSYGGDQKTRDEAYHQGTVWPWLLGHYAEGYLRAYGTESAKQPIEALFLGFEEVMREHGVGTISEVYNGDPPHIPGGAISQAWSVAELLRIRDMLKNGIR